MYLPYFGLKEPPFSIAPNPRYLFMSERHREALAHLVYGLQGTGGFVVLTGEVGAGKTTLARRFLEEIPKTCRVAYLINPNVTVAELLQTICDEFGIALPTSGRRADEAPSNKALVDAINGFLLSEFAAGRNSVVLVDEAQNLSPDVMEQLRLLTNLETSERKLLQIILIGQPELRELLARHDLRQVDQRVVARYHLDSLGVKDTEHYLAHRLAIAGGQPDLFAPAAATAVHAWTQGVPRRINVLADRALLGAYAQSQPQVTQALVNQAASEVFDTHDSKVQQAAGNALQGTRTKLLLWLAGLAVAAAAGYVAITTVSSKWSQKEAQAVPPSAATVAAPASMSVTPRNAIANSNTPNISPSFALINKGDISNTNNSISNATKAPVTANLSTLLSTANADQQTIAAPRALLGLWRVSPSLLNAPPTKAIDLCEVANQAQLDCYSGKANLATLRANNHPALLMLKTADQTMPVLIEQMDATHATVTLSDTRALVSLTDLDAAWTGEYSLLWKPLLSKAPAAGSSTAVTKLLLGAQGSAVAELLARLAAANSLPADLIASASTTTAGYDTHVQSAVRNFQLLQGLQADGRAGAQTLIRLNALAINLASTINQPRLQSTANVALASLMTTRP